MRHNDALAASFHLCARGDVRTVQSSPFISVVVLNYNGLRYLKQGLKECLDSVLRTNYPNFEVIFVDNGSNDNSADFVRENFAASEIKIVENKCNLGFSEGFNTGIRATNGKYVVLLSNDMTVDRDWLKPAVELLESDLKVGLVGFKRLVHGSSNLLDGIGGDLYLCGRVKPIGTHEADKGQYDINIDDLDFIGGAMVIRRVTLQEVGLFDPGFRIFSEDVDLCFRIRKRGYKTVYVHNAVIWHRGQATLKGMDPRGSLVEYMANRNRVRLGIIHFTLKRLFSVFLIDSVWFATTNSRSKMLLLKAYLWNLRNVNIALKKRVRYGPSPPFGCKPPIIPFRVSDLQRRMNEVLHV